MSSLNKCKYPRCKNKENDPLDIYCLDHSYPCHHCNCGGTVERADIGDGLDVYCNDCYKLLKPKKKENKEESIEFKCPHCQKDSTDKFGGISELNDGGSIKCGKCQQLWHTCQKDGKPRACRISKCPDKCTNWARMEDTEEDL